MANVTVASSSDISGADHPLVRTSGNRLYVASTNGTTLQMHKGNQDGEPTSFTSADTITGLTGLRSGGLDIAIDSSNTIHVIYYHDNSPSNDNVRYVTFNTSTDTFGTPETVYSLTLNQAAARNNISIDMDSNDEPHIYFKDNVNNMGTDEWHTFYANRIGGTWSISGPKEISQSNHTGTNSVMVADSGEGNGEVPHLMTVARFPTTIQIYLKGNALDPSSFQANDDLAETHSFGDTNDVTLNDGWIIDSNGRITHAYTNSTNDLTIATWVAGDWDGYDQWDVNNIIATDRDYYNPSMSVLNGTDRYIMAEDRATNDLHLWKDEGSGWTEHTADADLPNTGTFDTARIRWSNLNHHSPALLDYVFQDSTGNVVYNVAYFATTIEKSHSTNSYLQQWGVRQFTTDSTLKGIDLEKSHSTDSLFKKLGLEKSHFTDSFLADYVPTAITWQESATSVASRNTQNPTINLTPIGTGNLLVLGIYVDDTGDGDVTGVTDNQSNTWVQAVVQNNGSSKAYIYYALNPPEASTTITVATSGANTDTVLHAAVFQDAATTDTLQKTGSNNAGEDVTFSNDNANGLIFYVTGDSTNHATFTPYGTGQTEVGAALNGGAEKFASAASYELPTGTGSNNQTSTPSKSTVSPVAVVAEFNFASGPVTLTKNHTTDSLLQAIDQEKSHLTDSLLQTIDNEVSHNTDSFLKKVDQEKSHTTDSYLKAVDVEISHNTDSLLQSVDNELSHFTDAFIRRAVMVSHDTDALLQSVDNELSHLTDSTLLAHLEKSHLTDATLKAHLEADHTTDALLLDEKSLAHNTDSTLKKIDIEKTHFTDALLQSVDNELSHFTDSYLMLRSELTHLTDSYLKAVDVELTHNTDSLLQSVDNELSHFTDSYLFLRLTKVHTTDSLLKKLGIGGQCLGDPIFGDNADRKTEDFSTYNTQGAADAKWVSNDTGNLRVNINTDLVDFTVKKDGTSQLMYFDTGAGLLDDTAWIMRFKIKFTSIGTEGADNIVYIGCGSDNTLKPSESGHDWVGINYSTNDGYFSAFQRTDNGSGGSGITSATAGQGDTRYIEIVRLSSSFVFCRVADNSSFINDVSGGAFISGSNTNLRYITITNVGTDVQPYDTLNVELDDFRIVDGITEWLPNGVYCHITDSYLKPAHAHSTDAFLSLSVTTLEKDHNTDSLLQAIDNELSHNTDAYLKKVDQELTHNTDSLLQSIDNELTHFTDAYLKAVDVELTHNTDSLLQSIDNEITHFTDAYLVTQVTTLEVDHNTDAFLMLRSELTHLTDSYLKAVDVELTHFTDATLLAHLEASHLTDALLQDETSLNHNTDSYLKAVDVEVTHFTDSLLQSIDNEIGHNTDAFLSSKISINHNTDALLKALGLEKSHFTDALLQSENSLNHNTDAYLKAVDVEITHFTDALLQTVDNELSHFTDAYLQAVDVELTHFTDSTLKAIGLEKSHFTDALLLDEQSKAHNTDSYLKAVDVEITHFTDSLLQSVDNELSHFTDAFLVLTSELTHLTDAYLKAIDLEVTHFTDATLKGIDLEKTHFTDAFLTEKQVKSHLTDAALKALGLEKTHFTDALLQSETSLNHNTDAYLKAVDVLLGHDTDALLQSIDNEITHFTDAQLLQHIELTHFTDSTLKGIDLELTHFTDALLQSENSRNHNTDAYLKAIDVEITHFTDATLKGIDLEKSHFTDAFLQLPGGAVRQHFTDALLMLRGELGQQVDSLLLKHKELQHTTDALLQDETSLNHNTDSLLKAIGLELGHDTDSLLQSVDIEIAHNTDSWLMLRSTLGHTTDSRLKGVDQEISHGTDSFLQQGSMVEHTTDATLLAHLSKSHFTDSWLKEAFTTVIHTTDSFLRQVRFDLPHTTDAYLASVTGGDREVRPFKRITKATRAFKRVIKETLSFK